MLSQVERVNPLHTILSDGAHSAVQASERERRIIEGHVGRYVVTWSLIDQFLGIAIAAWMQRPQTEVLRLRTSQKLNELRTCLPNDWLEGRQLVSYLDKGRIYRNSLAHLMLGVGGMHDGRAVGWNLWDPHRHTVIELVDSLRVRQERDAKILCEAVLVLMRQHYLRQDAVTLSGNSLAGDIKAQPGTWPSDEEYESYMLRVDELFPGG